MGKKITPKGKKPRRGHPTQKLTAKQKKLAALLPKVEVGEMTLADAIRQAGYAESTAMQQSNAVGGVRNNVKMQEELRKVGFNEQVIAEQLHRGLALLPGKAHLGYVMAGAELLDAKPAKKVDVTDTTPLTYGDLERKAKPKTLQEAQALAEED